MEKVINNRNLILINFGIILYFIALYLLNHFEIDFVLIGVFRELFTIPFMLGQLIALVIGVIYLIKNKIKFLTLLSVISLAVCAFITITSLFQLWSEADY